MEVELTLALRFTSDHMLLEIFRVRLLAAMVVHVARDRALKVVVELSPTLVGGRSLIVLPGGMIVGLVLPFDLLHSSQNPGGVRTC